MVDVLEEDAFVDGGGGDALIIGVGGETFVWVPLLVDVGFVSLIVEEFPLLYLFVPFLVFFPVIITSIWEFINVMTDLNIFLANPLAIGCVVLSNTWRFDESF
jgi:hypothetical protein